MQLVADVCVEYLEQHPEDPQWHQDCVGWLEQLASQPPSSLLAAEGAASSVSSLGPVPRRNLNVSKHVGTQNEVSLAVNPLDPMNLFVVSNHEEPEIGVNNGIFAAYSTNGGKDWQYTADGDAEEGPMGVPDKIIADGAMGGLPLGRGDPVARFDEFGNLFLAYLEVPPPTAQVIVALSTDGGATFDSLAGLGVQADRPNLATGPGATSPGSVWVTYLEKFPDTLFDVVVQVATVSGAVSESGSVGSFGAPITIASSPSANELLFTSEVAVGPTGEAVVVYQKARSPGSLLTDLMVSLDPDGLGLLSFDTPRLVVRTNLTRLRKIPAQQERGIFVEQNLAWDRSVDASRKDGVLHLVYTDERLEGGLETGDTDIFAIRSLDRGVSWSDPLRINSPDSDTSQFLATVEVDQSTGGGELAVSWHDARNDPLNNKETELYASVSLNRGESFLPNVRVSEGISNEDLAEPAAGADSDYAEYTGLAFADGMLYAAWADNSDVTLDNPDAPELKFEIYSAQVPLKPDSDADGMADELDNCEGLVQVDELPTPQFCDTDLDGYGNFCDGDFDNDGDVDASDFSQSFLPCFTATVDSGVGCDMDCDGDVDASDFSQQFMPQFTFTTPGPSGLPCAGTVPCEAGDEREDPQ